MSYAQFGLIQATDYNGFVGADPTTGSGSVNAVWGTGNGSWGYGQTPLSQSASTGSTVTATQWSTLISTINNISIHQTGSGASTSATPVVTGNTITYLSTLSTDLTNIYNNHLGFYAQGSTLPGSGFSNSATATNAATYGESTILYRYVTFSSGDAARYFFNAGGQINFIVTSVTNNDSTSRSADAATLIGTNLGAVNAFRATTNGGRAGTGGSVVTNNTSFGYYNLTTTWQNIQYINSSSGIYTSDYVKTYFITNGSNLSGHGDAGNQIGFAINYYSAHSSAFNDTLNITVNTRVDIVFPESTYLTNSWGTPTIT